MCLDSLFTCYVVWFMMLLLCTISLCIIVCHICCRYHLDLCKKVFGEGIYPEVDKTNIYYGGTNIAGLGIDLSFLEYF